MNINNIKLEVNNLFISKRPDYIYFQNTLENDYEFNNPTTICS